MYVCLCNAVTDGQIKQEICQGACSLKEVCKRLGVATQCGKCGPLAKQIVEESLDLHQKA